ncbi:MAG: hypothetical protein H5T86_08265 [Armatimonadetes bacterium]|nr:hypothetical protein [Armatimonadota bacterium]
MANDRSIVLNGRTAVNIGLVIMLCTSLVASAVTWGKMQAQLAAKLDQATAEKDFVRKADLSRQLDAIEARLGRIEDKVDRLLEHQARGERAAL